MRHWGGIALLLAATAGPALADSTNWDGTWSGQLSTGAKVAITISGGQVKEYRFGRRSASIAYGEVTAGRVSFSPGSAAQITMTPAGQNQANYAFTHPQLQNATGLLSRASTRAPAANARAARIPEAWFGTWGQPSTTLLGIGENGITYSYQGTSYTVSNISTGKDSLTFNVGPAGRATMKMRPDLKADYTFTLEGKVSRSQIWRKTLN